MQGTRNDICSQKVQKLLAYKKVCVLHRSSSTFVLGKQTCNTGRIVRWLLILLKFDFIVVVKQGKIHLREDHLSWMTHGEKPIRIEGDLLDAYLFQLEMVPKWSEPIVSLLTIGNIHDQPPQMVEQSKLCALLVGRLYKAQKDWVLSLCIELKDQCYYFQYAQ